MMMYRISVLSVMPISLKTDFGSLGSALNQKSIKGRKKNIKKNYFLRFDFTMKNIKGKQM